MPSEIGAPTVQKCAVAQFGPHRNISFRLLSLLQKPSDSPYGIWFLDTAFPHTDNMPTFFTECSANLTVASDISLNLTLPKLHVAFWRSIASWASVPEAAIHKDSDLLPKPAEIWTADNWVMPSPAF
jgi:hypothetical protein